MSFHADWVRLFQQSLNPVVRLRALRNLLRAEQPGNTDPQVLLDAFQLVFADADWRGFPDPLTLDVRGLVIQVLKWEAAPAFLEPFMAYLTHPQPHVRTIACEVLGALEDASASGALLICLRDPVAYVRRAAAFALAQIADPTTADPLLSFYLARPTEDINVRMGFEAALRALGVSFTPHPWMSNAASE